MRVSVGGGRYSALYRDRRAREGRIADADPHLVYRGGSRAGQSPGDVRYPLNRGHTDRSVARPPPRARRRDRESLTWMSSLTPGSSPGAVEGGAGGFADGGPPLHPESLHQLVQLLGRLQ